MLLSNLFHVSLQKCLFSTGTGFPVYQNIRERIIEYAAYITAQKNAETP